MSVCHSIREEVPMLLPIVCDNEDVDIIELFINLPALSEMTCPLTVANIQQHQAGDPHVSYDTRTPRNNTTI